MVHHKDGDKGNNAIDNLEIMEFGEHTAQHHRGTRHAEESKRTMEVFGLMREELKRERLIKGELLEALEPFCFGDEALEEALFSDKSDDAPMTITVPLGAYRKLRKARAKAKGET